MSKDIYWQKILHEEQFNKEQDRKRVFDEGNVALEELKKMGFVAILESVRDQIWECGEIETFLISEKDHSWWLYKSTSEIQSKDKYVSPILRTSAPKIDPIGGVEIHLGYSYPQYIPHKPACPDGYGGQDQARYEHIETLKVDDIVIRCVKRGDGLFAVGIGVEKPRFPYVFRGNSLDSHDLGRGSESCILLPEQTNVQDALIRFALPIVKGQSSLLGSIQKCIREIKDAGMDEQEAVEWIKLFEGGKRDISFKN